MSNTIVRASGIAVIFLLASGFAARAEQGYESAKAQSGTRFLEAGGQGSVVNAPTPVYAGGASGDTDAAKLAPQTGPAEAKAGVPAPDMSKYMGEQGKATAQKYIQTITASAGIGAGVGLVGGLLIGAKVGGGSGMLIGGPVGALVLGIVGGVVGIAIVAHKAKEGSF